MPIRQRPYGALAPIYFLTPPQGKGNPGRKNEAVEDHKKTTSVILLDARKYTLTQKAQDAAFKPADL